MPRNLSPKIVAHSDGGQAHESVPQEPGTHEQGPAHVGGSEGARLRRLASPKAFDGAPQTDESPVEGGRNTGEGVQGPDSTTPLTGGQILTTMHCPVGK